jgi:hypothetical protein
MVKKKRSNDWAEALQNYREVNKLELEILSVLADAMDFNSPEPTFDQDGVEIVPEVISESQMRVVRARAAVISMMKVPQARKAAGMPRLGRGKTYDPEALSIESLLVKVAVSFIRKEMTEKEAIDEVMYQLSPKMDIDPRTAKSYLLQLVHLHQHLAAPSDGTFIVER